jgi:hypothetical protein
VKDNRNGKSAAENLQAAKSIALAFNHGCTGIGHGAQ